MRTLITAQEILVDNSSYPTKAIERNSHAYRPLGLGYANLGALLMSRGLPYDSDAGRDYAAAITALMTGEAYAQSARVARDHGGPFAGYEANREPFLRVMRKHRDSMRGVNGKNVPADLFNAAKQAWDDAVELGPVVHDAAVLALPVAPLCREDCPGPDPEQFPVRTEDGDEGPVEDPRWAALRELQR